MHDTGDYLGEPCIPAPTKMHALTEWRSTVPMLKAWAGVILSVALASLIIYKAVIDRRVVKSVRQRCRIRRLMRPQRTG